MLAIAVLALGTIFDIGLMPGRDASGQQILVLCSGKGPMQMVLDPATGKLRPAEPTSQGRVSCDWAGVQSCGLIPAATYVPMLTAHYETVFSNEVIWLGARKVTSVRARGPPFPV
jgi:hypothetical protein